MINPVSKIIGKPISGKILAVAAVVFIVLVTLLSLSYCANRNAQRELGSLSQSAAQCAEDNRNQTSRLNECILARKSLVQELEIERDAAQQADAEARIRDQERLRELDQARANRARILEGSPSCAEWAAQNPCLETWNELITRRRRLLQEWTDDED